MSTRRKGPGARNKGNDDAAIRAAGIDKFGPLAKNWKIETIKAKLAAS
ncbi:MAG: hypothetical protein AAF221_08410 [Pseudomonadota bacterium]